MTTMADSLYVLFGAKVDTKSVNTAKEAIDGISSKLKGAAAAFAAGFSVKLLADEVTNTAAFADQQIKAARAVGITVEALGELEFAAGLSGLKVEELRKGVVLTNKAVQDAAKGNQDYAKTFRQIGLNARELQKLAPDQAFERVVGALQGIEDKGKRAFLVQKLLGEEGVRFASLIEGGAAGLQAAREEARARGLIISEQEAVQAELFNDSMDRLRQTSAALKRAFFIDLLPALQEVLNVMLDFQKGGLDKSQSSMQRLAATLRSGIKDFARLLKEVLALYKAIGELQGALKLLLIALVAFYGAKGLIAAQAAINGMTASTGLLTAANLRLAASTAAAFLGYVAVAAAIGLVLLGLDDLRGWIEGEDSLLGEVFGEYDAQTLKDIQGVLLGIGVALAVLLGGTLGIVAVLLLAAAALVVYWDDIGAAFEAFFDDVIAMWNTWVESLDWDKWVQTLKDDFTDLMKDLEKMWDSFVAAVLEGLKIITEPIGALADKVSEGGAALKAWVFGDDVEASSVGNAALTAAARNVSVAQTNRVEVKVDASGMSPEDAQLAVAGGVNDALLRQTALAFDGTED